MRLRNVLPRWGMDFRTAFVSGTGWVGGLVACAMFLSSPLGAETPWPRPVLIPLPASVAGVAESTVSLGGTWKFTMTPPERFWENTVDPSAWSDLEVPGEPWMQGFAIDFDKEYPYKKSVEIPADFAGKRVFLRFDGVYSLGRVWINGHYVGAHNGGFTSWQLDITDWVSPGSAAWLTVAITDLRGDPSFATGYAGRYLGVNNVPHRIGGILRDVTLFALPATHLTRMHARTDLDATYENATLRLELAAAFPPGGAEATVHVRLTGPDGGAVEISPSEIPLTPDSPEAVVAIPLVNPLKWDAEHPHLYTLEVELRLDDEPVQSLTKKIGVREIELVGNRMLVNGREVKLRGGCRHSIHPLAGRADLPEMEEMDVRLYKRANLNYIRTSHYPTTEHFLDLCDQYGIYVEEEMAICWVDHGAAQGVLKGLADDPAARPYFMRMISETLERDLSHPSIIIWSIGNENVTWGANFEQERDYARAQDPTRLLKTGHNHYRPGWNTDEHLDLDSYHYPAWNMDFDKAGKPYLYDEYCHVMTYYGIGSIAEIDPNIRNFWGESLKVFWDGIFPSQGSLGGAIWGTVDEVFLTPEAAIGYGRWGIFDGWRRPKPEYWLTKKGYSPIRIAEAPLGKPEEGEALKIPVKNWFDHTDFNELEITWEIGEETGVLQVELPAHADGEFVLPGREWKADDLVHLRFRATQAGFPYLVDEFQLRLVERTVDFPAPQGPAPALHETADEITVTGANFELVLDKGAGSIKSGTVHGDLLLTGGPFLNLVPFVLEPFALSSIAARTEGEMVRIDMTGTHGSVEIAYRLKIDGNGLIETSYEVDSPPANAKSYSEVGIGFQLASNIDGLEWDRKGLYSVYPGDHIGRNQGFAARRRPGPELVYRQEPTWPWALDMKEFHQHGPGHVGYGMTNDFRSAREYIYHASAVNSMTGRRVRIESDGASHAVRMGLVQEQVAIIDDADPALIYKGTWKPYRDDGDHAGTEMFSNEPGASVEYAFTGSSARWIGAKNNTCGKADVYLDGKLVAEAIDTYADSKQHQQVLFEVADLPDGPHRLRIVGRADHNPASDNTYLVIDGFSAIPPPPAANPDLRVVINRQWAYDLGWGNYGRSSTISSGFRDTVRIRLMDGAPLQDGPPTSRNIELEPDRGIGLRDGMKAASRNASNK